MPWKRTFVMFKLWKRTYCSLYYWKKDFYCCLKHVKRLTVVYTMEKINHSLHHGKGLFCCLNLGKGLILVYTVEKKYFYCSYNHEKRP